MWQPQVCFLFWLFCFCLCCCSCTCWSFVHGWTNFQSSSSSSSSSLVVVSKSKSNVSMKRFSTLRSSTTFALYNMASDSLNDNDENDDDDDDDDNDGQQPQQIQQQQRIERASISGVSVSKKGFHAMLDTSRGIIPIAITKDPQDSYAATSPESLTLIQLLSGVDMAGAILPPETLSKMTVLYCEFIPEVFASPSQRAVVEYVQQSLPKDYTCFAEAHPWIQSRVKLPQVTLDQLDLIYDKNKKIIKGSNNKDDTTATSGGWICRFRCALKGDKWKDKITMEATPDIVMPVTYKYEPETSALFTCLCLALRYKAPIVIENLMDVPIPENLDQDFPQRTTVKKLRSTSTRVTENIERGFEIHTLTKALQIAMEKGDQGAVERIRAKLDEYDSMDDLPTIPEGKELKSDDGGLDDLDENILQ